VTAPMLTWLPAYVLRACSTLDYLYRTMATNNQGNLIAIADNMRTLVQAPGWAQHTLPRGLQVIFQRTQDSRMRLAMARETVYPSDTEVELVCAAFGVPEGAETQRSQKAWTNPKTGRAILYSRIEVYWREV